MKFALLAIIFVIPVFADFIPHEVLFRAMHSEPTINVNKDNVDDPKITEKIIIQKVDHFNRDDVREFKMRYLENCPEMHDYAPIVIILGGEREITTAPLKDGIVYDFTRNLLGCLYYIEHRYYGKTKIIRCLTEDIMEFLTVTQAIADIEYFINNITSNVKTKQNNIILVGDGYSGLLATLVKAKHPKLVSGVWGSSLTLFETLENKELGTNCGNIIKSAGGEDCFNRIKEAFMHIQKYIIKNDIEEVKKVINLCNIFTTNSKKDAYTLFTSLWKTMAATLQNSRSDDIKKMCFIITAGNETYEGFRNYFNQYFNISNSDCIDFSFETLRQSLSNTNYQTTGMRQWHYQICHELGWFATPSTDSNMFNTKLMGVDMYEKHCQVIFPNSFNLQHLEARQKEITEPIKNLIVKKKEIINYYLTHGDLDPFHKTNLLPSSTIHIITGYGHAQDFGSLTKEDSNEMEISKYELGKWMKVWSNRKPENFQ